MSSLYPDSLPMLLQKARAICTVNQDIIAHTQARKGHKVITKHHFSLQTKPTSYKSQIEQHGYCDTYTDMFELVSNTTAKHADDIIAAWTYHGQPLAQEKITIDGFIDRKIAGFDDLVRLNTEYGVLLDKYSQFPDTCVESRVAVECVMRNMEILQVAIGDVHGRVLDTIDIGPINDAVSSLMEDLSKAMRSFESKVSGARLELDLSGDTGDILPAIEMARVNDCKTLTCKHELSDHTETVRALQTYVWNGRKFLASASDDGTIKLWDLSDNTLAVTLIGHNLSLTLYAINGVPMLASGSKNGRIRLCDLSTNNYIKTLSGNYVGVNSLTVYETSKKTILISGSGDGTIRLWDLHTYTTIDTLQVHQKPVFALCVYDHDGQSYLASGSYDESINIWDLNDYCLVRTIDNANRKKIGVGAISSLLTLQIGGQQILASGDYLGSIKLWSVGDYECIETINAHASEISSLEVLECDGKICLVSASRDKTIKIWDLESHSVITTLLADSSIRAMTVFMNRDRACLATSGDNGLVKLWKESQVTNLDVDNACLATSVDDGLVKLCNESQVTNLNVDKESLTMDVKSLKVWKDQFLEFMKGSLQFVTKMLDFGHYYMIVAVVVVMVALTTQRDIQIREKAWEYCTQLRSEKWRLPYDSRHLLKCNKNYFEMIATMREVKDWNKNVTIALERGNIREITTKLLQFFF